MVIPFEASQWTLFEDVLSRHSRMVILDDLRIQTARPWMGRGIGIPIIVLCTEVVCRGIVDPISSNDRVGKYKASGITIYLGLDCYSVIIPKYTLWYLCLHVAKMFLAL